MSDFEQSYTLGAVKIQGPTVAEKRCSIFLDLANVFKTEFTSEAVDILKNRWKDGGYRGRLDIDFESDFVSVLASKSIIVDLALLINNYAPHEIILEQSAIDHARKVIKSWKQPKPFAWGIGDVFSFKLIDGMFSFGQILDKTSYNAPTCLLFSYKAESEFQNIDKILKSQCLSILHVFDDDLNQGLWKVIGNTKPILAANSGPCGARGAVGSKDWNGLEVLSNAWHCLRPWNNFYTDDYLDKFLLEGVTRPKNAIILTKDELEKYGIKRPEWN